MLSCVHCEAVLCGPGRRVQTTQAWFLLAAVRDPLQRQRRQGHFLQPEVRSEVVLTSPWDCGTPLPLLPEQARR